MNGSCVWICECGQVFVGPHWTGESHSPVTTMTREGAYPHRPPCPKCGYGTDVEGLGVAWGFANLTADQIACYRAIQPEHHKYLSDLFAGELGSY